MPAPYNYPTPIDDEEMISDHTSTASTRSPEPTEHRFHYQGLVDESAGSYGLAPPGVPCGYPSEDAGIAGNKGPLSTSFGQHSIQTFEYDALGDMDDDAEEHRAEKHDSQNHSAYRPQVFKPHSRAPHRTDTYAQDPRDTATVGEVKVELPSSEEDNASGSDYKPKTQRTGRRTASTTKKHGAEKRSKKSISARQQSKAHRRTSSSLAARQPLSKKAADDTDKDSSPDKAQTSPPLGQELSLQCPDCDFRADSRPTLRKHRLVSHIRPFTCTFRTYGCNSTFGTKNEWKRHVATQHLRLGYWRCDFPGCRPKELAGQRQGLPQDRGARLQSKGEDFVHRETDLIFNDFNRKDLFTQHLKRMHVNALTSSPASLPSSSPIAVSKITTSTAAIPTTDAASAPTAKGSVTHALLDNISTDSFRRTRSPAEFGQCGFCTADEAGMREAREASGSWEARMEHVGRHLEKGDGNTRVWREDLVLRDWALKEGILECAEAVMGGKLERRFRLVGR
ncbi:hypothetical protein MMC25_007295 [Agyrium rufum]|nr:hypothetical protein [Agyrium rufum]